MFSHKSAVSHWFYKQIQKSVVLRTVLLTWQFEDRQVSGYAYETYENQHIYAKTVSLANIMIFIGFTSTSRSLSFFELSSLKNSSKDDRFLESTANSRTAHTEFRMCAHRKSLAL